MHSIQLSKKVLEKSGPEHVHTKIHRPRLMYGNDHQRKDTFRTCGEGRR